jgi:hypothetical protein
MLTNVLYVPALQRNLFSVSSAAFKNVDTLYTKTRCQILFDGVVLMEGSLEGMLYKLHIRALLPSSHAQVIQSIGTSSKQDGTRTLAIWHQRLCHIHYPTILAMERTEAVTCMILQNKNIPEFCRGCVLGKSHRHAFISQPIRTPASIPGYQVHADICGPMAHVSLGGAFIISFSKTIIQGFGTSSVSPRNPKPFDVFKKSTATFSETQETIYRFSGQMAVGNSLARGFKITSLRRGFVMRSLLLILLNKMVSANETIVQLWRVFAPFSTPVGFL